MFSPRARNSWARVVSGEGGAVSYVIASWGGICQRVGLRFWNKCHVNELEQEATSYVITILPTFNTLTTYWRIYCPKIWGRCRSR